MQGDGDRYHHPERWDSTNLVGIPAWLIASLEFNHHPQPLHIAGARETHRGLFRLLNDAPHLADAAEKFRRYMDMDSRIRGNDDFCNLY